MLKHFFETYKGIIFDLNGTIVDDQNNWQNSYREVFEPEIISENPIYGARGSTLRENIYMIANLNTLRSSVNLLTIEDRVKKKYFENFDEVTIMPGFFEFATRAKQAGVKLALVTNSDYDIAFEIVTRLGIRNLFDIMLSRDDVGSAKPSPELFEEAVKRMGFKKEDVVVFEDSPLGSLAADFAGLKQIIVLPKDETIDKYSSKNRVFIQDFRQLNRRLDQSADEYIEEFFQ